jgi:hypothetical protein
VDQEVGGSSPPSCTSDAFSRIRLPVSGHSAFAARARRAATLM